MNQENPHNSRSTNEEVDLIRLLNYFKNGVKSFFKFIWRIFDLLIQFIVILKKNWIIVLGLTVLGLAYGLYTGYSASESRKFEMVVKANPITNIELYSFSSELNNNSTEINSKHRSDLNTFKKLGILKMEVEPLKKNDDIIFNYFDQIDRTSFRGDQTDTLYFKAFNIENHQSKMDKYDFTYQKIKLTLKNNTTPFQIQEKILNYINDLPGVKREQESQLAILTSYEKELQRNVTNIDSLLVAKAKASKNATGSGSEQVLVNTASRSNVEPELLRYSEIFLRKLYGTQKMIADNQKGINIVSDLRLVQNNSSIDKPYVKYSLIGFLLSCIIILIIQFNKYLNKYSKKSKNI